MAIPGLTDELEAYRRSETELRIAAVYGCAVSALVLERIEKVRHAVRDWIWGDGLMDRLVYGNAIGKLLDDGSVERVAPAAFYTWPDKED